MKKDIILSGTKKRSINLIHAAITSAYGFVDVRFTTPEQLNELLNNVSIEDIEKRFKLLVVQECLEIHIASIYMTFSKHRIKSIPIVFITEEKIIEKDERFLVINYSNKRSLPLFF